MVQTILQNWYNDQIIIRCVYIYIFKYKCMTLCMYSKNETTNDFFIKTAVSFCAFGVSCFQSDTFQLSAHEMDGVLFLEW